MQKIFENTIKDKLAPILMGILLVLLFTLSNAFDNRTKAGWDSLENLVYDLQVRFYHRPLEVTNPISIVDIDDKSLKTKGRWPWSRKILAELVEKLYVAGATVVALDITFPEPSENIANAVYNTLKKEQNQDAKFLAELKKIEPSFDYDEQLAKSLKKGDSVISIVFSDVGEKTGFLPTPFLKLDRQSLEVLDIPEKPFYLGNIEILNNANKHAGFLNATPDPDGTLRFNPLLYRHGTDIYASLGLEAVRLYLLVHEVKLVTAKYGQSDVLEGIKLDQTTIPTDNSGRILIPYRGKSFSFPYVSAADILDDKFSKDAIEGRLIFIGFSASALTDNYPTSIAPIFPGVEIHATVASGIIDKYLPYHPSWDKGLTTILVILLGLLFSILLPFLSVLASTVFSFAVMIGMVLVKLLAWVNFGIDLPILLLLALLLSLYCLNVALRYIIETRRSKQLKIIFGQYVPSEYVEEIVKRGEAISLEGETKQLTVLFADIRNFTNLSETMTATDLKKYLNRFFNPMTEVIFNYHGTIDKYVGDMVMAFWGAPLENLEHASSAVNAALDMKSLLSKLNQKFVEDGMPEINISIGINTGNMNVGDMGSQFRRAYTVIGDSVNLASRLEGQGKFYHVNIIVGETTWLLTKEKFVYKKLDNIRVKGKEKAVVIYQPVCKKEELTPEINEELQMHHDALQSYFNQEWNLALMQFEKLKLSYPENGDLYSLYMDRIVSFTKKPFNPNWDGTYVSVEK